MGRGTFAPLAVEGRPQAQQRAGAAKAFATRPPTPPQSARTWMDAAEVRSVPAGSGQREHIHEARDLAGPRQLAAHPGGRRRPPPVRLGPVSMDGLE